MVFVFSIFSGGALNFVEASIFWVVHCSPQTKTCHTTSVRGFVLQMCRDTQHAEDDGGALALNLLGGTSLAS